MDSSDSRSSWLMPAALAWSRSVHPAVPSSNAAAAVTLSAVRRGPECTTDTLAYASNPAQTSNRGPSDTSVPSKQLVTHDVSTNDLGLGLVLLLAEHGHHFHR